MTKRLGAFLCLILGAVLIFGGLTAGNDATGGVANVNCGGSGIAGAVAIPPSCRSAQIVLTKVVVGTGSLPTGGGWDFRLTSSNCTIPTSIGYLVPLAGGTITIGPLYQATDPAGTTPCLYTLTENLGSVAAYWTEATDAAPGFSIPLGSGSISSRNVTITNTAVDATTAPPSSTPPSSTPPASPTQSVSVAPTSASVAPTSASVTPTPTSTTALASTGAAHVGPELIAGVALVALGLVLLLGGRRPRRTQH